MALYKQSNTFIDALCMTRALNPVEHKFLWGQMLFMHEKEVKHEIVPGGWTVLNKHDYTHRLSFYAGKGRRIASLTIGVIKGGYRYWSLAVFPSQFRLNDFNHFAEVSDCLLEGFGYTASYYFSRVSYLEVGVDQLSVKTGTFIPSRKRCVTSSVYVDAKGTKGTVMLGSASSAVRHRIYDKHRQLLEAKNCTSPYPIQTRIEAALRHLGMPAAALAAELPNPFRHVGMADIATARKRSASPAWHAFLDRCVELGSPSALGQCNEYYRRKFAGLLHESRAGWWHPSFVWAGFSYAMTQLAPSVGLSKKVTE